MFNLTRRAALGVAMLLAVTPAIAQPISYQGRVTDEGGIPIGAYEVRFEVYPQLAGGTKVGTTVTRSFTFAEADQGVFSFSDLGFGGGVFTGADRWIEVAVKGPGDPGFTVLAPRQPVAWSPRSIFASDAAVSLNRAYQYGTTISNAGLNPVVITGRLDLGSSTTNGVLQLFQNGTTTPVLQFFNASSQGGSVRVLGETGLGIGIVEADAQGTGMLFQMAGDGGDLLWDGDLAAGEGSGSLFSITGPGSSMSLNTSLTGDSALSLPASSVSAAEIVDEPGVASINQPNGVALNNTIAAIISRSITVPGPGHIVVLANCNISVQRTSNVNGTLNIGVSTQPSTLPSSQTIALQMPPSASTFGQYNFPGGAHAVFQVESAGTFTYYFNGRASGYGTPQIFDSTLTLIYVPTAYGTVTPTPTLIESSPNQTGPVFATLSAQEILVEQLDEQRRAVEAMREEQRRMAAELAALRKQVQEADQ